MSFSPPPNSPHPPTPSGTNAATHSAHEPHFRPHLRQLALQAAAAFAVLSLAWPYYGVRNIPLPWAETTGLIGATALLFAILTHQPWWWRLIHTVFAPLLWGVTQLAIDPGWFLLAFCLLLLVYRGALSGQVPLYLSNTQTATALVELMAGRTNLRFLDLGAGIGSTLRPLAEARPDAHFCGIENAPATWLIGRLRTAGLSNCNWQWGDIWKTKLNDYDVVYAFLSPAPMPALWEKARQEMRPGSLFISNSFAVPEVIANTVIEVDDARQTRLYCYAL